MNTEVVKVTPEMAAEFLEGTEAGANYRPEQGAQIDRYSLLMRKGQWKLTHQGIAIDTNGNVIDGQHRLRAVIQAGVPVEFLVTTGLPAEDSVVFDIGLRRTAAQALTKMGLVNGTIVAGATRAIVTAQENPTAKTMRLLSPLEISEWVATNVNIAPAASAAQRIYKSSGLSPSGVAAGLCLVADRLTTNTPDADTFLSFVEGVESGVGLSRGDARLGLRNMGVRSSAADRHALSVASFTIKAWNAYVIGRTANYYRFRRGEETFPKITMPR